MLLPDLTFGSLFSYAPKGTAPEAQKARDVMTSLKVDRVVRLDGQAMPMSEATAAIVASRIRSVPFASLFDAKPLLVPVPSSSLHKTDSLWVPDRIARALLARGLGGRVEVCLRRVEPVPKAAHSPPQNRPLPARHYETIAIDPDLAEPQHMILIDDVITRGATLLGAASRLKDAYPGAEIRAFAAMRTISDPEDFRSLVDPCVGTVTLRNKGDTIRDP